MATAGAGWLWCETIRDALAALDPAASEGAGNTDSSKQASGRGSGDKGSRRGRRGGAEGGNRAVPVIIASIEARANDHSVAAIGTARALRSVTLYPKTDGEVMALKVATGERVKTGDIILKIDDRQPATSLRLAEKTLQDAQRKLKRVEYLEERNITSVASVEDAQIAVDRARLEIERAKTTLRDTLLQAPFDGVVGIPKIEPGDRVTTTTAILTLDDRSTLLVEFEVPEDFISKIAVGDEVVAQTPGFGDRTFAGHLTAIDSRIDTTSRTVTVRAAFPNENDLLRPGMSFAIDLKLPGRTHPAVPELALQWRQGESFVWLVENGKAKRVPVKLVRRLNGTVLLDGEINPGELIVVEGVQRLRPGIAVKMTDPPAASPSQPQGQPQGQSASEAESEASIQSPAPSPEEGPTKARAPSAADTPAIERSSAQSTSRQKG